jgi:hypothetical protein
VLSLGRATARLSYLEREIKKRLDSHKVNSKKSKEDSLKDYEILNDVPYLHQDEHQETQCSNHACNHVE